MTFFGGMNCFLCFSHFLCFCVVWIAVDVCIFCGMNCCFLLFFVVWFVVAGNREQIKPYFPPTVSRTNELKTRMICCFFCVCCFVVWLVFLRGMTIFLLLLWCELCFLRFFFNVFCVFLCFCVLFLVFGSAGKALKQENQHLFRKNETQAAWPRQPSDQRPSKCLTPFPFSNLLSKRISQEWAHAKSGNVKNEIIIWCVLRTSTIIVGGTPL